MAKRGDTKMTIRLARPEDLDAILRIERSSFGDPWDMAVMERDLSLPHARIEVLCTPEQEVVAFVDTWLVLDELEVHDIAVAPEHRRRGLGKLLLEHVLENCRLRGVRRVLLEVRESNIAAQRLYRSLGFEVIGRRRRYYQNDGEDALTMALELEEG